MGVGVCKHVHVCVIDYICDCASMCVTVEHVYMHMNECECLFVNVWAWV